MKSIIFYFCIRHFIIISMFILEHQINKSDSWKTIRAFSERVFWRRVYPTIRTWHITVTLPKWTYPLIITVIRFRLIRRDLFFFVLSVGYLCRWLQLTLLISPLALYYRLVFISCRAIEFDAPVSKLYTTILPISPTSTFCFQEETRNRKHATSKLMYRQQSWIGWNRK